MMAKPVDSSLNAGAFGRHRRPLLLYFSLFLVGVAALSGAGELPLAKGGTAGDVLAARFDDVYTDFVDSLQRLPSEAQLVSLQALDSAIHSMSGVENAALWTEAAVQNDPRWQELREIARTVLQEFGLSAPARGARSSG